DAPQRGDAPAADEAPRLRGDLIYGRNPVHEALRAGRREVKRVWATQAASGESWLNGVSLKLLDTDELTEKAGTDAHQGIVAQAGPYPYVEPEELLADPDALIVALDEVQDPQNLGAIARSAEAAGATGLVILERRSAEVTAAAAKASAGAVEHLKIARARNLADFLTEAKEEGFWVYGADGSSPVSYTQVAYDERVILVLGAEGKGIRPRVRSICDQLVALPLRGRIESLNVSATAAVLLYEAVRTRTS
ncbi:MAG TPA: 23S rRNA (guanosine(2251)-2'-O)-methyltransferase RlmB, partial [Solirubrobacteraceae bacterium]|nr:23S rRNA (guanosine(2251)-2'-O)-methyltransferase RlmB [Solirubrobacteraceae bacterium]